MVYGAQNPISTITQTYKRMIVDRSYLTVDLGAHPWDARSPMHAARNADLQDQTGAQPVGLAMSASSSKCPAVLATACSSSWQAVKSDTM